MKIQITRDCGINGEHIAAGTVIDLPDAEAINVINMGKATPSDEKKKTKDRSVGLTTQNAAPIKTRSRKK